MSAKEIAEQDIREDLKKQSKCFLAFRSELNPVMRRLVREQLHEQMALQHPVRPSHTNSQLVAHCFLTVSGEARLMNYSKYYK